MYRCINRNINIKEDLFNKKIIPYQKGVKKTFYGFTSISTKENTIYYLNGKQKQFKEGTVFTIHGNYFGYDISLFNNSLEEEIIIEPENNFLVESAVFSNNYNHIKFKFENYNKVLEDIIKPDGMKILYELTEEYMNKGIELIRIFGNQFVDNQNICKLVHQKKVYDLTYFFNISHIKDSKIEITLFGFQNNINISHMFSNCTHFSSLPDCSKINLSGDLSYIFHNCKKLLNLPDISKWDISNVTNINSMFEGCESLTSLPDLSKWNITNIINANSLFKECKSLIKLPNITKWNTTNLKNASSLFSNCKSLIELPDL